MNSEIGRPISFWGTVRLLLRAARARTAGRRKRQRELLQQRSTSSVDWSGFSFVMAILVMALLNGCAAFITRLAVESGQRVDVERSGRIVVSQRFLDEVRKADTASKKSRTYCITKSNGETNCWQPPGQVTANPGYSSEARRIAERYGGQTAVIERKLRDAVRNYGSQEFVAKDDASPGLAALSTSGRLPVMLGSVTLIWWAMMLVFQGEGLELDLQRRRHPMWEWLFSHPVQPS